MAEATPQLDANQAHDNVFHQVTVPAFFTKMAQYGIQPQSWDDAQALLDIGHNLMQRERIEQVKAARASGNFYQKLANELTGRAAPDGFAEPDPRYVSQLVAGFMGDPTLVKSAVVMQDAALAAMQRANNG